MPTPDFQVETRDGVIAISGHLDFTTANAALDAVNAQMAELGSASANAQTNAPAIDQINDQIIDLSGVTHSNSAGLALMIEWMAEAQRTGRTVRFENIPNSLRQISTVCQVDSLI